MQKRNWLLLNASGKISGRRTIRFAGIFLFFVALVALFASLLCNEKPLYAKYNGVNLFPALSLKGYAEIPNGPGQGTETLVYSTVNWSELKKEKVIWCPVKFSPGKSDWTNAAYKSPFESQVMNEGEKKSSSTFMQRHWLGTTKTGADVLSGLVHGARVSPTIGIFSMIIAGFIGILLGAMAGFFGDNKLIISETGLYFSVLSGLPCSYFYGFYLNRSSFASLFQSSYFSILLLILYVILIIGICQYLTYVLGKFLGRLVNMNRMIPLRLDQFISRGIEIFNSIPRIVLIITLSAIAHPSILSLVLIIGFTSWTEIARLVRAEMLKVRASEYMQSAEASGIKILRQVFRHALPNVIVPAITAITLGVASAILTESALSFLGIGVPADVVTWGSLLNEGRQNFSAWWLIVFPGLAIFSTVTAINILGSALADAIGAKTNQE